MSELKPCPFCGGEAELTGFDAPEYWVWCPNCKASADAHTGMENAIAAWNSRAERTCRETTIDKFFNGCDSCGYMWQFFYSIGKRERPNYCPNCGCKVVGE